MALKKTLAQRLFNITKCSAQTLKNCRVSSALVQNRLPQNPSTANIAPDPGDNGIFRRFLHKKAMFQPKISLELHSIPIGANLMEKLREMDFSRDRIRLNELAPPAKSEMPAEMAGLTVEDARKLMTVAQMEIVKSRLREIEKCWISYKEYVRICVEGCSDPEQGSQLAKKLDESGNVIVLGNLVCLRPEQEIETFVQRPKTSKGFFHV